MCNLENEEEKNKQELRHTLQNQIHHQDKTKKKRTALQYSPINVYKSLHCLRSHCTSGARSLQGEVLRQAASCHTGCTGKDQKHQVWMSAVCVDEQNIFISTVTCPGFLKVTDAGAACSVSIGRVVIVNTP